MHGRFVIDTNTIISRMLLPSSVPARAVASAMEGGTLLVSHATLTELSEVLSRAKFDQYVDIEDRKEFLRLYGRVSETVIIIRNIKACRDPRDNKFLELAVNGSADCIITGDRDLLELNPFENVAIMTPAEFLRMEA